MRVRVLAVLWQTLQAALNLDENSARDSLQSLLEVPFVSCSGSPWTTPTHCFVCAVHTGCVCVWAACPWLMCGLSAWWCPWVQLTMGAPTFFRGQVDVCLKCMVAILSHEGFQRVYVA